MRRLMTLLALGALCCLGSNIEEIVPPAEEGAPAAERESHNGFFPGLVNLATCWLEVPRVFTYEATARPRSMVVVAPVLGASLTGMRALQGVGNILTLGLCDNFIRGDVPEYVWDALWLAPRPEGD